MLCRYKSLGGSPGQGIHSTRLFGLAAIDVIFTLIGALAISWIFKTGLLKTVVVLFVLGIIAHRVFCVDTKLNTLIFGKVSS